MDCVKKMPKGIAIARWENIDANPVLVIQLCLFNEVLKEVVKEIITNGIWEILQSLYMAKSVTNRLQLKSRLYDLLLEEGKPLKPHLDEFYTFVMDLQNIKVKLNDEDLVSYLLCSLHPSYNHFRETLLNGRDNLSDDDVKNSLTQRDLIDSL